MSRALTSDRPTPFSADALDDRIAIREAAETVEIDFTGLVVTSSVEANALHDRIEERIAETGEPLWFFLLDHTDYRVWPEAWFAFSRRGRDLTEAHSMRTVRVEATAATARQIDRNRGTELEDRDLFASIGEARAALAATRSRRRRRVEQVPSFDTGQIDARIRFDEAARIMEVDFRGLSFEQARDVNDVYNVLEERLRATGRKWYFLIDYDGTRIQSPAWVQYATRGKALNERWSLGSVRYAPGSETETDIRLRAESQGFRPNIRNTREEALERIAEMKEEARQAGR